MAWSYKKQSKAIIEFTILSVRKDMDMDTWEGSRESVVWYSILEVNCYSHPEGEWYQWCRIFIFDSKEFLLGYVLLPSRYKPAWECLCKNIVFYLCEWKLWIIESKKQPLVVPEDVFSCWLTLRKNWSMRVTSSVIPAWKRGFESQWCTFRSHLWWPHQGDEKISVSTWKTCGKWWPWCWRGRKWIQSFL